MQMRVAILLFFIVAMSYMLIIDVFTVLFRMTGLTNEKAKFQVISLLTNSGFTTKESEVVVSNLVRRRLARTVMLFGYIFSITIVTVFVNVVISFPQALMKDIWLLAIVLIAILAVFLLVKRVPRLIDGGNRLIEKYGKKWIFKDMVNPVIVLDEFTKGVVAEVSINALPKNLENVALKDSGIKSEYGLRVIMIKRRDCFMEHIDQHTIFEHNDRVIVFGALHNIRSFFKEETADQIEKEIC